MLEKFNFTFLLLLEFCINLHSVNLLNIMSKVSKIASENRVLTAGLFKTNFGTIRAKVRAYLAIKYRYSLNGNRVTAQTIDDYLQEGIERLFANFDFEQCLHNGEEITIYGFQKLWFYASQQAMYADNVRATINKKGTTTKIVVTNIVSTDESGKEGVSNVVENKLLEIDNLNSKKDNKIKLSVRKKVRNAIENAKSERDRVFFERVLAHLLIQSSIRRMRKVNNNLTKSISLVEVIDCFTNQFKNKAQYLMFKNRLLEDERLNVLKAA
jgi:hypothetical protein